MKQLVGLVLVKERNIGVPQLVVELYDTRDATDFVFNRKQPLGKLGRRLGSVLTDGDGRFVFSASDLEFQGNEARPNVVIAVLAPEDVRSIDDPVPLPPEQRLLFLSAAPRLDAGADEAYVVRLLDAQLDRFGILTGGTTGSRDRNTRVADAVEGSWETSSYLSGRFQERIKERLATAVKSREKAKGAVANLSAIPLHLRDSAKGAANKLQNNTLLIGDRRDLATSLATLQETALTEGIKRLDGLDRKPTMRVYFDPVQARELGITVSKTGVASGTVDGEALRTFTRAAMKGTDLVRIRGLENPSTEELRKRYLTAPPLAPLAASTFPATAKAKKTVRKPQRRNRASGPRTDHG